MGGSEGTGVALASAAGPGRACVAAPATGPGAVVLSERGVAWRSWEVMGVNSRSGHCRDRLECLLPRRPPYVVLLDTYFVITHGGVSRPVVHRYASRARNLTAPFFQFVQARHRTQVVNFVDAYFHGLTSRRSGGTHLSLLPCRQGRSSTEKWFAKRYCGTIPRNYCNNFGRLCAHWRERLRKLRRLDWFNGSGRRLLFGHVSSLR